MAFTFKRGIHPKEEKHHTEDIPIKVLLPAAKSEMVFPMSQHLGALCEPIVSVGQKVLLGEKIGDSTSFVSAPVHASVSGIVTDIRPHMTVGGTQVKSVIIECDGEYVEHESIKLRSGYSNLTKDELLKIIREAGIVGLGGAGFPTQVKLSPPPDKKIDTVIVNGCECEPYLTTDNRVMLEESDRIVLGLQIILKILPGARGIIAIEDNKPEAIAALKKACETALGIGINVAIVKTKYPQGAEKQLISAITKREVPSGGLPADIGVIVNNVDTVIAIHRAVIRGRPLMRKVVTLTGGALRNPGNYKARLGTKIKDLIEMSGGFKTPPAKVVVGGPMMGVTIFSLDVPIIKTTSALLCLTEEEAYIPPEQNCIRCGKCVEHCPAGILPFELNTDIIMGKTSLFLKHNGFDCIECGSCSYVCPSKRHLAQSIRAARRIELTRKKK